jgi:nucleoside-diphosphate-sugar epimerase
MVVLVIGVAGFVGQNSAFLALKKRGDGAVVAIDNFKSYYEISLKRSAGQEPLAKHHILCD